MTKKRKQTRKTAATRTPAQDRLLKLLRKRGEVRRVDALKHVSASTIQRAIDAGKAVKVVRGRAVYFAPARVADPAHVVRMTARRTALEGVPGGRIDALSRLLAGAGRTPGEHARDFFLGR